MLINFNNCFDFEKLTCRYNLMDCDVIKTKQHIFCFLIRSFNSLFFTIFTKRNSEGWTQNYWITLVDSREYFSECEIWRFGTLKILQSICIIIILRYFRLRAISDCGIVHGEVFVQPYFFPRHPIYFRCFPLC